MTAPSEALVDVRGLQVDFRTGRGWATAVDGLDLQLHAGRTLVVLGESGSGKSAAAKAIMGVLPRTNARVPAGRVLVRGEDLLAAPAARQRELRGPVLGMIFQDALAALNPVLPVGYQITEGRRSHTRMSRRAARALAADLLGQVGIPSPAEQVDRFPHQFSGGMRQRVMIAAALAQDPEVLIADEPTTALDVTVQAQILRLLSRLQSERGMSLLLITHDMGVVADMADDIVVMYAGRAAERGGAGDVFDSPAHPYTRALKASIPGNSPRRSVLPVIPGQPPDIASLPSGCAFRVRCPRATQRCTEAPPVARLTPAHLVACHHPGPDAEESR